MIALFIILPIFIFLAFEWLDIKKQGLKDRIKGVGFWLSLGGNILFSLAMLMFLFMSFTAPLSFSLLKLFAVAISSAFFLAVIKLGRIVLQSKKVWIAALLFLTVALFLEGTVFNFRAYQTAEYEETDLTETIVLSGLKNTGKAENEYKKQYSNSTPTVFLPNIDQKV